MTSVMKKYYIFISQITQIIYSYSNTTEIKNPAPAQTVGRKQPRTKAGFIKGKFYCIRFFF